MSTPLPVKICGLTREADIDAAIAGGAAYLGFIFYPPSKRSLTASAWAGLARHVAGRVPKVGVFVDADDDWIRTIHGAHPLDYVQLHGSETVERLSAVRALVQPAKIIKSISISARSDVERSRLYEDAADMLLFDTKPPKVPGSIPGGNGLAFDWRLLADQQFGLPWLLAGGISATNLISAIQLTRAPIVDISSSVEDAPGIKNEAKLRDILALAKTLGTS